MLICLIIIGLVAGLLSGFIGIGGGIITVPSLFLLFHFGICDDCGMRTAIATSLSCMIPSASLAVLLHWKGRNIDLKIIKNMFLGIICGGFLGAYITSFFSNTSLENSFGIFLILLSCLLIYSYKRPRPPIQIEDKAHLWSYLIIGFVISLISVFMGISGGLITAPLLMMLATPPRKSVGTSSLVSLIITIIGATSFFLIHDASARSSNHLFFTPALYWLSPAALLGAPIGVWLSKVLSEKNAKLIFGCILAIIGVLMVIL